MGKCVDDGGRDGSSVEVDVRPHLAWSRRWRHGGARFSARDDTRDGRRGTRDLAPGGVDCEHLIRTIGDGTRSSDGGWSGGEVIGLCV